MFIGGFFGPIFAGVFADRLGRRPAIFWGSAVTLIGVLLQTAAQNVAMFVVARIVLGFGSAVSGIAGVFICRRRFRAGGVRGVLVFSMTFTSKPKINVKY